MSEQEEQLVSPEAPAPRPEEAVLPPLSAPAEAGPPAAEPAAYDQQAAEDETFQRPRGLKDLKPGMVLEGKVTSVAIYGVFVDIGVGREGLVHVSQLSDRPVSSPTEVVRIGDMVTVRVLEVDPRSKRINLTMRERVEPELDHDKLAALTPGSIVEGTVTSLTRFGAFVDLGVGKDGLVPMAQMSKSGAQTGESVQVGEQVQVRVMDVDKKNGRIRLSMRNVYGPEQLAALQPGAIVHGRVTSLAPFGAFVDLGVGKDGLIHVSTMGDGSVRHPREVLRVGQEVDVRVVEVSPETQRISLSMRLEEEEEEEWAPPLEPEEEEAAEPAQPATLEDLAARFSKLRAGTRGQPPRRTTRAEKERRAVQEALRRTLEESREEKKE
jgi:small subunit ribosomal protein S1